MRILLLVAVLSISSVTAVRANDAPLANLNKAKAAHAKELARLRDKLLADIDAVIRKEADAGAGVNYLLKEKKGFEENGILPILPKLLPASRAYVDGKIAADAALEKAYTAAIAGAAKIGDLEQVTKLRDELNALRADRQSPTLKDEQIEKDIARAKSEYAVAMKAASTELVAAFENARARVAASTTLTGDEKNKQSQSLANEQKAFEASVAFPKSPAMRTALQQFSEAAR